jgi:nucleoid-associated protein YgaU
MHLLVNEVQDMLNYCVTIPAKGGQKEQPGLYTRMWSDLCDFDQKVASFDVALPSNGKMTKAQMIQAVEQGAARSGWWETLSEKNASLAHVAEDDIVTFGKTIDQWRAVAASVRFKTYVTVDGDTLESIAQTYYGSGSFTQNLFDANKAIFTPANPKKTKNGNEVVAGTLLKIFETDALPYVVN